MSDDLSADERRALYTFLAVLAVACSTVIIVLVVRDAWSSDRWVALGSVAALIQSFAVVAALVYAARQLRASHDLAMHARRVEVADRLEALAFDVLEPAVERLFSAATGLWALGTVVKALANEEIEVARRDLVEERVRTEFAARASEANDAALAVETAVRRVERTLKTTSNDNKNAAAQLMLFRMGVSIYLPRPGESPHTYEWEMFDQSRDRCRTDWQKTVDGLLDLIGELAQPPGGGA